MANYVGSSLSERQHTQLKLFRDWLATEARTGGGIGPNEVARLERRHITDSLLFARMLPDVDEIWDLGSGVGLPGIPLAILLPATRFRLLDRSGRQVDLIKRAVRVLDLEDVVVEQVDVTKLSDHNEAMVSRATIPPDRALQIVKSMLTPGGIAVFGGSWVTEPAHQGWETVEVGREILDQPVWFLIMRRQ